MISLFASAALHLSGCVCMRQIVPCLQRLQELRQKEHFRMKECGNRVLRRRTNSFEAQCQY